MAMELDQEARIWQTIGVLSWVAGAVMLLIVVKENGVVRVQDLTMLSVALAASFLMLAGISGTVFGRALYALLRGYNHLEARLWHTFAMVCCSCGTIAILYVAYSHWTKGITLDYLTIGLAGSFLIMCGVICLLGNRVMHHASLRLASLSSGEPAKAARA